MSETRTAAPAKTPSARLAQVRSASVGLVLMLIIEFVLGIVYNLYGSMPPAGKSIGLFSNGWLVVHEIMAILVLAAAIDLVIRAMRTGHGRAKAMSWVGLIAVIAAIGAGLGFTRNGDDGASLGMSLAFAVALTCYVLNIVRLPADSSGAGS